MIGPSRDHRDLMSLVREALRKILRPPPSWGGLRMEILCQDDDFHGGAIAAEGRRLLSSVPRVEATRPASLRAHNISASTRAYGPIRTSKKSGDNVADRVRPW